MTPVQEEEEGALPDEGPGAVDRRVVRDPERDGVGLRHDAGGALRPARPSAVQPPQHQSGAVVRTGPSAGSSEFFPSSDQCTEMHVSFFTDGWRCHRSLKQ